METIIASSITGVVAIIVCILNSYFQATSTRNLIDYKLNELTKRVEKHNNVIERVYQLEKDEEVIVEKLKTANHRIADLEAEIREVESGKGQA